MPTIDHDHPSLQPADGSVPAASPTRPPQAPAFWRQAASLLRSLPLMRRGRAAISVESIQTTNPGHAVVPYPKMLL